MGLGRVVCLFVFFLTLQFIAPLSSLTTGKYFLCVRMNVLGTWTWNCWLNELEVDEKYSHSLSTNDMFRILQMFKTLLSYPFRSGED